MIVNQNIRDAYVSASVWAAYDAVAEDGLCTVAKPLPGWRVDRLYADGTIGDYQDDGTREAVCLQFPGRQAIFHNPGGCHCGYRIVRDVYVLLQYVRAAGKFADTSFGWGIMGRGSFECYVLTRVVGTGTAARITDPSDPPGTVRVTGTRLVEVYVPRTYWAETVPTGLVRKIRDRYGVTVRTMPGDLYSFKGSPDTVAPEGWPECMPPTGWHESGNWGLHGAAGALLSTVMDGERYFLLVQRSRFSPFYAQKGLWQLPGGALDTGETPLEAATRETFEELGIPELGGGSVVGEVVCEHRTGWQYTNYAVTVDADPGVTLDRKELQNALWFDRAGLLELAEAGELVPAFAEKLPELLDCFGEPVTAAS